MKKSFLEFVLEQTEKSSRITRPRGEISAREALKVHFGLSPKEIPKGEKQAEKLLDALVQKNYKDMNPDREETQDPS